MNNRSSNPSVINWLPSYLTFNLSSLQVRITEPSEGFKIGFHDHLEAANVANKGFVVSPGLQYFIQLGYREVMADMLTTPRFQTYTKFVFERLTTIIIFR